MTAAPLAPATVYLAAASLTLMRTHGRLPLVLHVAAAVVGLPVVSLLDPSTAGGLVLHLAAAVAVLLLTWPLLGTAIRGATALTVAVTLALLPIDAWWTIPAGLAAAATWSTLATLRREGRHHLIRLVVLTIAASGIDALGRPGRFLPQPCLGMLPATHEDPPRGNVLYLQPFLLAAVTLCAALRPLR